MQGRTRTGWPGRSRSGVGSGLKRIACAIAHLSDDKTVAKMGHPGYGLVGTQMKQWQQAGVVVCPEAEALDGGYRQGYWGDFGAVEEGVVSADEDPGCFVGSAGLVGGAIDLARLHAGGGCELRDLRGEVEVLVGDMKGQDAVWGEVFPIECDGLGGEQVERDGVSGEGVDDEDVEVLRGF